ncbi:MAG TPA: cytochrome c oxidase subunit II [Acidimicrobiales bacterium]|nr:cytochrome c oxidase subunit II [Acidimicrobiales bacterium]
MSPRSTKLRTLALAGVVALASSACASGDLEQNALDPEGPVSRQLDRLWDPVFAMAAVIFFLVNFLCIFVIVKYRAKGDDDAPKQVHGNARLEIAWTILPALILAVVGVFTVATIFDINERADASEVLEVEVIGHQWWFEYRYPSLDVVTANELHIPAGERVQLKLGAADVIHSFWPPKLAGKVDTVPGRTNYMQIEADEPGTFWGQCAEYCGLSHGYMRLKVVAHDAGAWDEWVETNQGDAEAASGGEAAEGQELFITRGCGACHTIEGLEGAAGKVGPDLTHLQSRDWFGGATFELNERNLRRWLRNPPEMKPMRPENNQGMPDLGLSEEEITKLIAYLETLK